MYPLLPMNNSTTESDVQHEDYWCPLLTSGVKESKAMADQLATVSKSRLFGRAGIISEEDMLKVVEAVRIQLDIP